jgi:hypothetical protein
MKDETGKKPSRGMLVYHSSGETISSDQKVPRYKAHDYPIFKSTAAAKKRA